MKEYQNSMKNKITKQRTYLGKSSYYKEIIKNNTPKRLNSNSEMKYKIKSDQNCIYIRKFNVNKTNRDICNSNKSNLQSIYQKESAKFLPEQPKKIKNSSHIEDKNSLIKEIEKLKKLNQNSEMRIRKLDLKLKELKSSYDYNNQKNKNENDIQKIQDELIFNKDLIISSLKEDLEKSNKKSEQMSNKFKICETEIKFLRKENNKLNSLINSDNNFINNFTSLFIIY